MTNRKLEKIMEQEAKSVKADTPMRKAAPLPRRLMRMTQTQRVLCEQIFGKRWQATAQDDKRFAVADSIEEAVDAVNAGHLKRTHYTNE